MTMLSALLLSCMITGSMALSHGVREHINRPRQSISTGSCGSVQINFIAGVSGQPNTYVAANQQDFAHGPAGQISTITSFICDRLQSPCIAPSSTISTCNNAASSSGGIQGGQAADTWNAAFGINTNFSGNGAQHPTTTTTTTQQQQQQPQQQQTTPAAQITTPGQIKIVKGQPTTTPATTTPAPQTIMTSLGSTGLETITLEQVGGSWQPLPTDNGASQTIDVGEALQSEGCILQAVLVTVTLTGSAAQQTGNPQNDGLVPVSGFTPLNLGTCTDPTIQFGQGLGGRQANEWAFMNHDISQFNHGSALDITTIAEFTCNNLVNMCGLSTNAASIGQCNSAQATAGAIGNKGSAADAFNRAMGFVTYYAAVDGSG